MNQRNRDRFWRQVEITPTCWLWRGDRVARGYGRFMYQGKVRRAHRIAWELTFGPPFDQEVCHHCDNPPCVRPSHLFLATHQENMRDAAAKGRTSRLTGQANGRAKITDQEAGDIRERRAAGERRIDLAREYAVDVTTIDRAVLRARSA